MYCSTCFVINFIELLGINGTIIGGSYGKLNQLKNGKSELTLNSMSTGRIRRMPSSVSCNSGLNEATKEVSSHKILLLGFLQKLLLNQNIKFI